MNISAVVEADAGITVDFETEVSSLDWSNSVNVGGNSVPAFRVRRETTRVKTYPGDVLILGGLIQTDELEQIQEDYSAFHATICDIYSVFYDGRQNC